MSPARRTARTAVLALIALAPLGGCIGLFNPADPDPPLSNNCAPDFATDPSSPTTLLKTLASAMALRARGRCGYIGAFADSVNDGVPYEATFPAGIVAERERLQLPVPAWRRTHELAYYDDFVEISSGAIQLKWSVYQESGSDSRDEATGDSTLHRRYLFTTSSGAQTLAAGVAHLRFRHLLSGRWVLTLWDDEIDPALPGTESEKLDLTISQRRLEAYDAVF